MLASKKQALHQLETNELLSVTPDLSKTIATNNNEISDAIRQPVRKNTWTKDEKVATEPKVDKPKVLYLGDKSKPKLLIQLAHFMKNEYKVLGVERNPPGCSQRLQVCRQVFTAFINEFKTYEPLLSEVKNEYEATFLLQRSKIEQLYPFKSKYSILEYENSQKMDSIFNEYDSTSKELARQNEEYRQTIQVYEKKIAQLNDDNRLLNKTCIRYEGAKHNEEFLEKKIELLIEELDSNKDGYEKNLKSKEHTVLDIQKELKKEQEIVANLKREMEMIQKYNASSVGRSLYDESLAIQEKLRKELAESKAQIEELESKTYQQQTSISEKERKIKLLNDDVFPDWDEIRSHIPTSIHSIASKYKGMSNQATITAMCKEFLKSKVGIKLTPETNGPTRSTSSRAAELKPKKKQPNEPANNFFLGLGISIDVPKFLRYKGKIPNRNLALPDIVSLINDIWKNKAIHNQRELLTLPDFLYFHLKKKFGTHDTVAEWGYNLLNAARKHAFQNAECSMFMKILTGKCNESLYTLVKQRVEKLKAKCIKYDQEVTMDRPKGFVPKEVFLGILREDRNDVGIGQLVAAVDIDQCGNQVSYRWLFGSSGVTGVFINLFQQQELDLFEEYYKTLQVQLTDASSEGKIFVSDIRRVLELHDPLKSRGEREAILMKGLKVNSGGEIPLGFSVSVASFMSELSKDPITKTTSEQTKEKEVL